METLYYNGVIRTMVSHIPEEALLVRDGRIAAVGEFGPMLEANPYVKKVDLQGACLMPAFLDAHSHIVSWAMGKLQADLSGAADFHAIAAAMADFARRRGIAPGQWVIGRGADLLLNEELVAELDRCLPDNPALVQHSSKSWLMTCSGRLVSTTTSSVRGSARMMASWAERNVSLYSGV